MLAAPFRRLSNDTHNSDQNGVPMRILTIAFKSTGAGSGGYADPGCRDRQHRDQVRGHRERGRHRYQLGGLYTSQLDMNYWSRRETTCGAIGYFVDS